MRFKLNGDTPITTEEGYPLRPIIVCRRNCKVFINKIERIHKRYKMFKKVPTLPPAMTSLVIDNGNFSVRKTQESWHITVSKHTDNNSKQSPRQNTIPS